MCRPAQRRSSSGSSSGGSDGFTSNCHLLCNGHTRQPLYRCSSKPFTLPHHVLVRNTEHHSDNLVVLQKQALQSNLSGTTTGVTLCRGLACQLAGSPWRWPGPLVIRPLPAQLCDARHWAGGTGTSLMTTAWRNTTYVACMHACHAALHHTRDRWRDTTHLLHTRCCCRSLWLRATASQVVRRTLGSGVATTSSRDPASTAA